MNKIKINKTHIIIKSIDSSLLSEYKILKISNVYKYLNQEDLENDRTNKLWHFNTLTYLSTVLSFWIATKYIIGFELKVPYINFILFCFSKLIKKRFQTFSIFIS